EGKCVRQVQGGAALAASRKSNGLRGFPFELQRLHRGGVVINRHFVAVLVAALVHDLLHFLRGFLCQRERQDRQFAFLAARGNLRDVRVRSEEHTSELQS